MSLICCTAAHHQKQIITGILTISTTHKIYFKKSFFFFFRTHSPANPEGCGIERSHGDVAGGDTRGSLQRLKLPCRLTRCTLTHNVFRYHLQLVLCEGLQVLHPNFSSVRVRDGEDLSVVITASLLGQDDPESDGGLAVKAWEKLQQHRASPDVGETQVVGRLGQL